MWQSLGRPFGVALVASVLLPVTAHAQAWVDDKGTLSLDVRTDVQTSQGVWHGSVLVTGVPAQMLSATLAATYVPVEHLSLMVAFNGNTVRYSGPQTIPGNTSIILAHGTQDDGSFHANITDLDFEARYQAYDGGVALTPFLRARTPLTDYENRGYAMSGTGLREAGLGFTVGRYGLGLEDLILQASYSFTFVQKESGGGAATEQYRTNRSDVDVNVAYVINDDLLVVAGAAFRHTHDGFGLEDYPMLPAGDPLITWHDPVLKISYIAPVAAASYRLNDDWSLSGRFGAIVWGRNASNAISFGLSIGWNTNLAEPDPVPDA